MIAIDVHLDADAAAAMARDVREGLSASPKELSPKYFYDERGSLLFEQITELEEYYPTRAERAILTERSAEILAAAGTPGTLVELGSGSASKTRHLLSAMRDAECLRTYVPVDISEEITHSTAPDAGRGVPGPRTCAASSATSRATWSGSTAMAAPGSSPSSAARSATSTRASGASS